jgi:hypothetical protein
MDELIELRLHVAEISAGSAGVHPVVTLNLSYYRVLWDLLQNKVGIFHPRLVEMNHPCGIDDQ